MKKVSQDKPARPARRKRPKSKRAAAAPAANHYVLRLYITGVTPNSSRAVANVKKICDKHLDGNYELEIIDVYQQPRLAIGDEIVAAPTLLKKLPLPLRRMIGDMSNTERTLVDLDLKIQPAG